jgi:hypothetical protein
MRHFWPRRLECLLTGVERFQEQLCPSGLLAWNAVAFTKGASPMSCFVYSLDLNILDSFALRITETVHQWV